MMSYLKSWTRSSATVPSGKNDESHLLAKPEKNYPSSQVQTQIVDKVVAKVEHEDSDDFGGQEVVGWGSWAWSGMATAGSVGVKGLKSAATSGSSVAKVTRATVVEGTKSWWNGQGMKTALGKAIGAGTQAAARNKIRHGEIQAVAWVLRRLVILIFALVLSFSIKTSICLLLGCWSFEGLGFLSGFDLLMMRVGLKLVVASLLEGFLNRSLSLRLNSENWAKWILGYFPDPIDYVEIISSLGDRARRIRSSIGLWECAVLASVGVFAFQWRYWLACKLIDVTLDFTVMTVVKIVYPEPWEKIARVVFHLTFKPLCYMGVTRDSTGDLGEFELVNGGDPVDDSEVTRFQEVGKISLFDSYNDNIKKNK